MLLVAQSRARRAAAAHFLVQLIWRCPVSHLPGALVFISERHTSPSAVVTGRLPMPSTIFNLANTVILLPLVDPFVKVVHVEPSCQSKKRDIVLGPQYLGCPFTSFTRQALYLVSLKRKPCVCAEVAITMVEDAVNAFIEGDLKSSTRILSQRRRAGERLGEGHHHQLLDGEYTNVCGQILTDFRLQENNDSDGTSLTTLNGWRTMR